MKHKLKAALLVGALLGVGMQAPVAAATAKKSEQQVAKKGTAKAASKAPLAAKSAGKQATKSVAKAAPSRHTGKTVAAHSAKPVTKPIRHASMMDMDADPSRLALYSASALVIDL